MKIFKKSTAKCEKMLEKHKTLEPKIKKYIFITCMWIAKY